MGEHVAASLIFTIRPSAPSKARRAFCASGQRVQQFAGRLSGAWRRHDGSDHRDPCGSGVPRDLGGSLSRDTADADDRDRDRPRDLVEACQADGLIADVFGTRAKYGAAPDVVCTCGRGLPREVRVVGRGAQQEVGRSDASGRCERQVAGADMRSICAHGESHIDAVVDEEQCPYLTRQLKQRSCLVC